MRTTLIFKGITESPDEKNWDDTTSLLAETLQNLCPETPTDTFIKQIERVHRTKPNTNKGKDRPIIAKFYDWKVSEKIKKCIIDKNKSADKNDKQIFVSQMYSQRMTERINEALKHRKTLLTSNPGMKMYVAYPTTLMGKNEHENKYKPIKTF